MSNQGLHNQIRMFSLGLDYSPHVQSFLYIYIYIYTRYTYPIINKSCSLVSHALRNKQSRDRLRSRAAVNVHIKRQNEEKVISVTLTVAWCQMAGLTIFENPVIRCSVGRNALLLKELKECPDCFEVKDVCSNSTKQPGYAEKHSNRSTHYALKWKARDYFCQPRVDVYSRHRVVGQTVTQD